MSELHPLLAHHVVNSLGWPSLRPLQQQALGPLMRGDHALVIAPTAGGKTEAAFFPVLSRMLTDDWRGLSVLYLCPLRALLNNLHPRLEHYGQLVGRRVGIWHGDIGEGERRAIREDPPDVLLTTPESVEAMLISSRTNHAWLFSNLRTIIVDEIHAFGSDDRGWHLLAVAQRLQRLAGREPQRIGLSATVGEPESLLDWLCRGAVGARTLLKPPPSSSTPPDVTVDHVGSLSNAAVVISRLHRGQKRLVFVYSRRRAEELTAELRAHDVETWLSHGSLGRAERARTEKAFATAPAGVIVATSTMELGIDVGDLDRVIQLDAPWTVAGFLQRLGRTGRRPETTANMLFLTTNDRALRDALALLLAWSEDFVEPVLPPPLPLHLVVQQLTALLRQEGALGGSTWSEWLGDPLVFGDDVAAFLPAVIDHLRRSGVLSEDGLLLQLGPEAERHYGKRHYLELTSVFSDPPVLNVVHGRTVVGSIHVRALLTAAEDDDQVALLIAGRHWLIDSIDWRRRVVSVKPAEQRRGKARWVGSAPGQSFALAQSARRVLGGENPAGVRLSNRASSALDDLRHDFQWIGDGRTDLVVDPDGTTWWWTFAGTAANDDLAARLGDLAPVRSTSGLALRVDDGATPDALLEAAREPVPLPIPEEFSDIWPFADLLPAAAQHALLDARGRDDTATSHVTSQKPHVHSVSGRGPRP